MPRQVSPNQEFDQKGHTNELINFCKSTGYQIANGLDKEPGNFTSYKPNSNSTVDYLLVKEKDFLKISNFEIGEPNENLDHCYLSLKIKKKTPNAEENTNPQIKNLETLNPITDEHLEELKLNYDDKFMYDNTCKDRINESLNSTEITDHLNKFDKDLDEIFFPVAVSRQKNILLKVLEDSMGKVDLNKLRNPGKTKAMFPG